MRKQILAAATALTLAAGLTTSAMAFDHEAGSGGRHVGHFHAGTSGGMRGSQNRHVSRFAGVRDFESWRHAGRSYGGSFDSGGYVDLGPLGFTTACGSYRYGHGYCGPGYGYGTPVDAWSR